MAFVTMSRARSVFDWPWLNQADREHNLFAISPLMWLSGIGTQRSDGTIGNHDAVSAGVRARSTKGDGEGEALPPSSKRRVRRSFERRTRRIFLRDDVETLRARVSIAAFR